MRKILLLNLAFAIAGCDSDLLDDRLNEVAKERGLTPLKTKPLAVSPKYLLGRALFFDPILSGTGTVACADCHVFANGSSDGLPRSVGYGGIGLGPERVSEIPLGVVHKRNSQDLWNRDHNSVTSMFWDGRIDAGPPKARKFTTPPVNLDLSSYENLWAVQAIFPVLKPDEMLHYSKASPHFSALFDEFSGNQLSEGVEDPPAQADLIEKRLTTQLVGGARPTDLQMAYRFLFSAAYEGLLADEIKFHHIANALAHYQELAFATRNTPWDRYLSGEREAISEDQKKGAIIFFGKGLCSECHEGQLFSDFEFHSIGVPSSYEKGDVIAMDFGRYEATKDPGDLFKHRTPPLRNVALTAPYFHNGSEASLEEAIAQHSAPFRNATSYRPDGTYTMSPSEPNAVSPILARGLSLSDSDIEHLVDFLKSLSDLSVDVDMVIPDSVPSGLKDPQELRIRKELLWRAKESLKN